MSEEIKTEDVTEAVAEAAAEAETVEEATESETQSNAGSQPAADTVSSAKPKHRITFFNLYYLWISVIAVLMAYVFPSVMDYYVLRPTGKGFWAFFGQHFVENVAFLNVAAFIVLVITTVLYALTLRMDIVIMISGFGLVVLGYASKIKYELRSEMVNYQDLFITEAGNIVGEYIKIDLTMYFATLLFTYVCFFLVAFFVEKVCKKYKATLEGRHRIIMRVSCAVVGICCTLLIAPIMYASSKFVPVDRDSNEGTTLLGKVYTCTLYSFFDNDASVAPKVREVGAGINYLDKASSDYAKSTDTDKRPNVIVVMNESWWNIAPLLESDIVCSEDPMAAYNELVNICEGGYVSVDVFGGGTISSETEFLTGVNTSYLSSSVGLSRYLNEHSTNASIVSYFDSLGYDTLAMHPYDGTFFGRNEIYETYGFDRMVFAEDMKYSDKYDAYISDESLAKQIIYEYENAKSDNPMFVWSVSIAAHGEGLDESTLLNEDYDYPIKVDFSGVKISELNDTPLDESEQKNVVRTVNSFVNACNAYKTLIDYFENVDEPTVVIMYGDHCPGIGSELVKLTGYDLTTMNYSDVKKVFTTPVLMWKNYNSDVDECVIEGENVNYLSAAVIDYAGLPDCDMARILRYMRSQFRAIAARYTLDVNGAPLLGVDGWTQEERVAYESFGMLTTEIIYNENETYYNWLWRVN